MILETFCNGGNGITYYKTSQADPLELAVIAETIELVRPFEEIIADGARNIWLCELGSRRENGSFDRFVDAIAGSPLAFKGMSVRFESPSRGLIEFGWKGPLKNNGGVVNLAGYPRYDNPYCRADFPPGEIVIRSGAHSLRLDYRRGVRETSGLV